VVYLRFPHSHRYIAVAGYFGTDVDGEVNRPGTIVRQSGPLRFAARRKEAAHMRSVRFRKRAMRIRTSRATVLGCTREARAEYATPHGEQPHWEGTY
jgi:hypothetical protein